MRRPEEVATQEEFTGEGVISVSPPLLVKTHMQFRNNMVAVSKRSTSSVRAHEPIPTRRVQKGSTHKLGLNERPIEVMVNGETYNKDPKVPLAARLTIPIVHPKYESAEEKS